MPPTAELGSILSTIDQLGDRLAGMADPMLGTAEEGLGLGILDVERQLRSAARRLERIVGNLAE